MEGHCSHSERINFEKLQDDPVLLVTLYVDQFPESDLSHERVARYPQLKLYPTIAEALTLVPDSYADVPGLLSRLGGRDVLLGFVESYGMTALTDERYRPIVGPRLDDLAARMEDAGLHLASGTLEIGRAHV